MEKKKDYRELYRQFERKYNKYPVQMAPFEAFRYAKNDGLVTDEEVKEAAKFFGNLWHYTGD